MSKPFLLFQHFFHQKLHALRPFSKTPITNEIPCTVDIAKVQKSHYAHVLPLLLACKSAMSHRTDLQLLVYDYSFFFA